MEEHELIVKRIQQNHETTIQRLHNEIERYKSTIKALKYTQKDIKRKSQNDLRDAIQQMKASNTRGASGGGGRRNMNKRQKVTTGASTTTKHDVKWCSRYEELKAYKAKHGHCNVDGKDNKDLWQWCQTQRTNYSHLVKGREISSSMTPERLRLLNSIHFPWVRTKTQGNEREEVFVVPACRLCDLYHDPKFFGYLLRL
jgi:hypothetical protein